MHRRVSFHSTSKIPPFRSRFNDTKSKSRRENRLKIYSQKLLIDFVSSFIDSHQFYTRVSDRSEFSESEPQQANSQSESSEPVSQSKSPNKRGRPRKSTSPDAVKRKRVSFRFLKIVFTTIYLLLYFRNRRAFTDQMTKL